MESWICNFCLSVAARKIEQIRPRDTLACCWDVKQPTNNNLSQCGNLDKTKQTHLCPWKMVQMIRGGICVSLHFLCLQKTGALNFRRISVDVYVIPVCCKWHGEGFRCIYDHVYDTRLLKMTPSKAKVCPKMFPLPSHIHKPRWPSG